MTRNTLGERLAKRNHRNRGNLQPHWHVRAELDRLKRKLMGAINEYEDNFGGYLTKRTIKELIKQAKR